MGFKSCVYEGVHKMTQNGCEIDRSRVEIYMQILKCLLYFSLLRRAIMSHNLWRWWPQLTSNRCKNSMLVIFTSIWGHLMVPSVKMAHLSHLKREKYLCHFGISMYIRTRDLSLSQPFQTLRSITLFDCHNIWRHNMWRHNVWRHKVWFWTLAWKDRPVLFEAKRKTCF